MILAGIAVELVALVRSSARGDYPAPQTSPFDRDEHQREAWARATAHHFVGGALGATEQTQGPLPLRDQISLLREITRKALWHMPYSNDELRSLRDFFQIGKPSQPHPGDDELPER